MTPEQAASIVDSTLDKLYELAIELGSDQERAKAIATAIEKTAAAFAPLLHAPKSPLSFDDYCIVVQSAIEQQSIDGLVISPSGMYSAYCHGNIVGVGNTLAEALEGKYRTFDEALTARAIGMGKA